MCYKYAWFVADHPWIFVFVPIFTTIALGTGYLRQIHLNDVNKLYLPQDGLSLNERAAILKNFPQLDGSFTPSRAIDEEGLVSVLIIAQDNGSVLRPAHRKAVVKLNEFVANNINVQVEGVEYSYKNVCLKYNQFCHTNPQLYALDALLSNPGPFDQTTFPTARHGSRRFYVGATLGGVQLDPLTNQIEDAKAWQLIYRLKFDNPANIGNDKQIFAARLLERQIEKILNDYDDDLIDVAVYHSETLNIELLRNGENMPIRFVVCVMVLWIFSQLCAITTLKHEGAFYIDWTRSKFIVAGCGLMGAMMGVGSATGFLAYCGYPYNSVCDAMPFLVLGVRLDNTFLMISAVHQTKRSKNAQERLAQAMSESAVSITITVLTDVLSFAIGLITDFLAVQMFSLYTVVAITITFMYQLTFLMGVLALSLRAEQNNKHNLLPFIPIVPIEKHDNLSMFDRLFLVGTMTKIATTGVIPDKLVVKRTESTLSHVTNDRGTWISSVVRSHYAPFLMKPWCRLAVLFTYVLYLTAAIFGCANVRQGLEPIRLVLSDSYAIKYYNRMERYFWEKGTQAQIVFTQVGDLANVTYRKEVMAIMKEFAESSHGMGINGLDFWLVSFDHFLREYNGQSVEKILERQEFFTNVDYFLSLEENSLYRHDIRWSEALDGANKSLVAFRGVVGLKNFAVATQQMETVDEFRRLAAQYPQHGIVTFSPMWMFVDQYEEVLPNTVQEIYGGVSFMVLIAIFFIPSLVCSLWVAIAILSIDAGVIGLMTFWGINMDVISMITIIMSIGFSVDFTAHVAYAYVVCEDNTDPAVKGSAENEVSENVRKTANALGNLAWPITQGAISTVMGVVVLSGTDSYISSAFFRTVLLVIFLGLAHALLFLPVALSVFSFKLSTKYLNFHRIFTSKNSSDKPPIENLQNRQNSNVSNVLVRPPLDIELKRGV